MTSGPACAPHPGWPRFPFLRLLLNSAATLQLVWFYLARVPSALNLFAYEQGQERTPFQQRLLLSLALRYAHGSRIFGAAAGFLNQAHGWFGAYSGRLLPESVLQAVLDIACVVLTGIVAQRIYQAASPTKLLTPVVYPLVLGMVLVTDCILVNHPLRFPYDFPAMAFFAAGLYLLYFRRNLLLFAGLFVIATVNRETTLLLLPAYWLRQCMPEDEKTGSWQWKIMWAPETVAVSLLLMAWWTAWHLWVVRHFAANASAAGPRLLLNLATVLIPVAWPQLLSAAAYQWPIPWLYRKHIADPTLRAWVWLPIIWLAFMLFFGLLIETRIFGELVPYFACSVLLIAEASITSPEEPQPSTSERS